jgi:hypothetical protein
MIDLNTHKLIYLHSGFVVVQVDYTNTSKHTHTFVKKGDYIVEYDISEACYKLTKVTNQTTGHKIIACNIEFESLIKDGILPIKQTILEMYDIYFNPDRKYILEEEDIIDAANYGAWYIKNAQNNGTVPRGNTLQWLSNRGLYIDVSGEENENGIIINVIEK